MMLFKEQQQIPYDTSIDIINAIDKAIDFNQVESVETLINFTHNTLIKTLNNNLDVYNNFISIPSFYYFKGYTSGHFVNIGEKAGKHLIDLLRFACLHYLNKAESLNEIKRINQIIAITYTGVSKLLFQIISNRDLKTFKFVMEKYELAKDSSYNSYIPKYLDTKKFKINEIEEKFQEDIYEYKKYSDSYRRIKFACLSWLWFLYDKSQIEEQDLFEFTNLITFERITPNELINDLIFYNTSDRSNKFDWKRWDYKKRKEMQFYSPPQPENWLSFGFSLYSLKAFNPNIINFKKIKNIELNLWLPNKLEKCFNKILEDKEKWLPIYSNSKMIKQTDDGIKFKIEKILTLFKNLKYRFEKSRDTLIVNKDLSVDRINFLKEEIYQEFQKNSSIKLALESFNNLKYSDSILNEEKENICFKENFKKAKAIFLKINNNYTLGFNQIGTIVASEIDNRFIDKVLKLKPIKQSSNLNLAIKDSVKELSFKGFIPNLIIISSDLLYNYETLMNNKDFTPSWQSGRKENIFNVGNLNNIPIVKIFNNEFNNSILVCDFNSFVKATEKRTDNNYKKLLDIQINTIDNDAEAIKVYEKAPERWKKNEDGIILDKDEVLKQIKLSIDIVVEYEILFEFLETEACEMYTII